MVGLQAPREGGVTMTTILSAKAINKSFGAVTAASNINIDVEEHSIVGRNLASSTASQRR